MNITYTERGFSANYGSPDANVTIDVPAGHVAYEAEFATYIYVAVAPAGFAPPAYLPAPTSGNMLPMSWYPIVRGRNLHPASSGVVAVYRARGLGMLRAPKPDELCTWDMEDAVRITEPVTGPLAPLDAAAQNLLSEVVMR